MYVVHVCEIEDISDTILGDTENPVELYIDRRAYLAEQIEQLESDLTEATGTKPVISDNGCLSFYKF